MTMPQHALRKPSIAIQAPATVTLRTIFNVSTELRNNDFTGKKKFMVHEVCCPEESDIRGVTGILILLRNSLVVKLTYTIILLTDSIHVLFYLPIDHSTSLVLVKIQVVKNVFEHIEDFFTISNFVEKYTDTTGILGEEIFENNFI